MELITKSTFMRKYGDRLIRTHHDDAETGDFMLLHPEEDMLAREYQQNGYELHSVYEPLMQSDEEDVVSLTTSFTGIEFGKIGYFVLR